MTLKDRIREAVSEHPDWCENDRGIQAAICKECGPSSANVTQWFNGQIKSLTSANLRCLAEFLNVNEAWLDGSSSIKRTAANIYSVNGTSGVYDVVIRRYSGITMKSGGKALHKYDLGQEDATVKSTWLEKNKYDAEKLAAIDVSDEGMAPRICSGDVLIINTDDKLIKDGHIYAIGFGGELKIKRVIRTANGGAKLVSDNDPAGISTEAIEPDGVESLNVIGRAVRVSGDLS